MSSFSTKNGFPTPFGASSKSDGINFSLYSKHATHASLCLFDAGSKSPIAEIALDPIKNRTGDVWHILVQNLPSAFLYAYRLAKKKGRIFCQFYQEENLILDPYAKEVRSRKEWGMSAEKYAPHGLFSLEETFDWKEDSPPKIPSKDLMIYEMHVRGFTQHASSLAAHPGTFEGIIEKIPHLKALGINCVKLLPIHEFNECEYQKYNPETGEKLLNYWGYSTINFFSPMARYSNGSPIIEFKKLVKELHKNGIEIILDVVFNHTGEGNIFGPIYSFKGIDASVYYLMDKKENYINYSGCGNTMNCNHPIVRQLIRSSLHYWVSEMHVDGFRFDLAAIMMRGMQGEPLEYSPLIEELSQDPILSETKLIAEPWDSAGLYCLGKFYPKEPRWMEWNDQYRDAIRKFIKGDRGAKRQFAERICGSEDIFQGRSPSSSINFITAHDGFTLRDLVSFNEKHNSPNGEDNKDGTNANYSWNCGNEGSACNEETEALRQRQMRNFHLALMISQGIPMIQMGDEYGHTKYGNNNSWCQDNQTNWFLWDKLERNKGLFRFCQGVIRLRHEHELFRLGRFLNSSDIEWHGTNVNNPDWNGDSQSLAMVLKSNVEAFYIAFNTQNEQVSFHLPQPPQSALWSLVIDTSAPSPRDYCPENEAKPCNQPFIELKAYSAVVLHSKRS